MILSPQSSLGAFLFYLQFPGYRIPDFITKRSIQIEHSKIKKIEKLQGQVTAYRLFYQTAKKERVLYFFNSKTFNTTDVIKSEEISLKKFINRGL